MGINKIDFSQKQLVDLITSEVMNYLKSNHACASSAKKTVLVLGSTEKALCVYSDKYEYFDVDSYMCDGDIEKYCFVLITDISNAQLCDIALGRDSTPFTCATQKALLTGKRVYMCSSALSYRKYKEKAAKELYDMLDNYVQKLVKFGIEIVQDAQIKSADNKICDQNEQYDSCEKLITQQIAQELCKKGQKQITLPKGTIITPLAKDLFWAEKININMR